MPIFSLREKALHHRGRLQNHTFPDSRTERRFCLGCGEDNEGFTGTGSPGVTTTLLLPSPVGEGQGQKAPASLPLVTTVAEGR